MLQQKQLRDGTGHAIVRRPPELTLGRPRPAGHADADWQRADDLGAAYARGMPGPAGGPAATGRLCAGRRQRLWVRLGSLSISGIEILHSCVIPNQDLLSIDMADGCMQLAISHYTLDVCLLICSRGVSCLLFSSERWVPCFARYLTAVMGRLVSPGGHVMGVEKWPDLAERSVNSIRVHDYS